MKYLVLGVNGMAGHMIAQYLIEQGYEVCGFAKTKSSFCRTVCGDATDKSAVLKALEVDSFDYVINALGVLNQYVDQNLSVGIYINSVLPHFLAEHLSGKPTKLIHISTDCVFEGTKGKYTEEDVQDATSYYGRSKALGEVIDDKNLTIRTSIVGPELKEDGIGLFHWFMSQHNEVYGYEKVMWSGVTTLQLAKSIAQDAVTPYTGLYHLVNNKFISKHDLLILFNKYCRRDALTIKSNTNFECDKTLICTHDEEKNSVPGYEEMVKEMADWIYNHNNLYQQYLQ